MIEWAFRSYVLPNGRLEKDRWYDKQSAKIQAAFDERIEQLSVLPASHWRAPLAKKMKAACDGLVEIRFKADRVQHRPLGFFGPRRGEFTILLCAAEKGGKLIPKNACNIAQSRRVDVENEQAKSRIFDVG